MDIGKRGKEKGKAEQRLPLLGGLRSDPAQNPRGGRGGAQQLKYLPLPHLGQLELNEGESPVLFCRERNRRSRAARTPGPAVSRVPYKVTREIPGPPPVTHPSRSPAGSGCR